MSSGHLPFELSIDGIAPGHLRVHSFTGQERLSEAWRFEVVVTVPVGDDVEVTALGQRATLLLNLDDRQRALYGIIASARLCEVHWVDQRIKYVVRIVPRLWLLRRKKRTRIFQKMRVPDIVSAVLLETGITARWQLTRPYPEREYCTQYEETDYQFVRRILAEAGIWFYFFGGGPVAGAALAADAAVGAAASAGGAVATFVGGTGLGGLAGAAAQMAEALIPGDTVVGADDAVSYPPVGGDDPAALAASTAAAIAPAVGDVLGAGGSIAGAAIGGASAIAGAVIASATEAAHAVPALHFLSSEAANVTRYDKVTHFTLKNQIRSSAATFRSYDPDRPMVRLESSAVSTQPFPPSPLEIAAQAASAAENVASAIAGVVPGPAAGALGAAAPAIASADAVANQVGAALGQKVPLEVYEHHDPYLFPKWAFAFDQAPRILRQKRRKASIAEGESGCSDFSPGHRFELLDHPATQLDATYVLTSVEHRGELHPTGESGWKVYTNRFDCVPAGMPYPPPLPKRASVQVMLTATVVGPAGEEIHVDEKGQIKVQFHSDRDGTFNEKSSCWIRVMQPWAGAGWGHQFIPRIGMEVVVTFEGGDPDKPLVLGSVYNGTHPSPFPLPANKTRSGWKTQSSPGGPGYNELSFEDAMGREQIHIHAQRNLDEVVEKNHTLLVRNDEFLRVVGGRMDMIEKNVAEQIKGDHTTSVGGNRIETVLGNSDQRVSGMLVTRIDGKERRDVQKNANLTYFEDVTTRVTGCMTTIVGKADAKRSWQTHAEGTARLSARDATEVSSEHELTLRVGKSAIRITSEKIEIQSPVVTVKGKGGGMSADDAGLKISSKGDAQVLVEKKLVMKSKDGASLSMQKEVKVDGSQILLNSPEQAQDPPPKDPDPPTNVVFKDQDGKPLAYQRYLITMADGSEISGMTDKDGKAEEDLKSSGKVTFPDLAKAK